MIFPLLASVCPLFSLASALPIVSPVQQDVWVPPITYPTSTTVWVAGGTYSVAWNTSTKPSEISNPTGLVYLRHGVNATEESVLTQGFPLTDGVVNVTIPANTQPDTDYIIIRKPIL